MAGSRRLAAIMFTDITGFTALAQADEAGALRLLKEQEKLVRPLLEAHRGRYVKSMGDGLLIEFRNTLDAIECAAELERQIHGRNAREGGPPVRVRVGIHLGDVQRRGTDILGDAVNIASRVQPLAEPEGICLSAQVYDQVRNKVPYRFEKLGPRTLKGVREPIDIYRVVLPWSDARAPPSMARPSTVRLAVLPLTNISPDPKDEYFADGLTEELISVLSQVRGLRVIARTSVGQYKGTTKLIGQIGSELGVSSVLEGSVRKAGDQLRIAVQLIDVASQEHVWANAYDRKLNDIFAVQADVARQVAEALKVELGSPEEARLEARPPVRSDSYLAYLKGRTRLYNFTPDSLEAAKKQFELAISLDPGNAAAYSGLADVTRFSGLWHSDAGEARWDETGRRMAARAIELDPNLAEAHASLGVILWKNWEYAAAEREFKFALSLNPSYAFGHHVYAALLKDEARADEALQEHAMAEATDPLWPLELAVSATLLIWLGQLAEARGKIQRLGEIEPDSELYHEALADYHLARSDRESCLQELHRYEETASEPRWKPVIRALYFALSGEKEQARNLLRHEEVLPEIHRLRAGVVRAYCELGDLDECFRWMEKGCPFQGIRLDPRLGPIRSDPRFPTLLRRMTLA